ncbi:MAG: prepilin-type N-terminal cleavage/methylation domain-containing protein [Phycisphaeraceae bacterium]
MGAAAKRRDGNRRAAGFTLIEALLAGVILAISGMTIGYGMGQAMQSARVAREYDEAAMLLDQVLTRIDIVGPERMLSLGPNEGAFSEPFDDYQWQAQIEVGELTDLYDVHVVVSWGRRRVESHTRLYDPPNARPGDVRWEDL